MRNLQCSLTLSVSSLISFLSHVLFVHIVCFPHPHLCLSFFFSLHLRSNVDVVETHFLKSYKTSFCVEHFLTNMCIAMPHSPQYACIYSLALSLCLSFTHTLNNFEPALLQCTGVTSTQTRLYYN